MSKTITIDGVEYPKLAATDLPKHGKVVRTSDGKMCAIFDENKNFKGVVPVEMDDLRRALARKAAERV